MNQFEKGRLRVQLIELLADCKDDKEFRDRLTYANYIIASELIAWIGESEDE